MFLCRSLNLFVGFSVGGVGRFGTSDGAFASLCDERFLLRDSGADRSFQYPSVEGKV